MISKAKPFIKWVGGKTQLIDSIEKTLPKDFGSQPNLTYIEPFVGGGAVLFWILQKYPNIKNVPHKSIFTSTPNVKLAS